MKAEYMRSGVAVAWFLEAQNLLVYWRCK